MANSPLTAVNIFRDKLLICVARSPKIYELRFSPSSIKDLEVVNQSELDNQIKSFVTANSLKPTPLLLVLSSQVTFEKDITPIPQASRKEIIQSFLDTVPFASISFKTFHYQDKDILVVINRNLYDGIKHGFEALGFSVSAVIPALMLGLGSKDTLSAEACQLIIKKTDFIKNNDFLSETTEIGSFQQKEQQFLKKHRLLVALFSLFFIASALGTVYYFYVLLPQSTARKSVTVPTIRPTRTPPTPTLTPTPTPGIPIYSLSLQILNASGIPGQATALQRQLTPLGFSSIKTGNASVNLSRPLIVFSPRVSVDDRNRILEIIRSLYPDNSVQESAQGQYDVIITIAKSQTTP